MEYNKQGHPKVPMATRMFMLKHNKFGFGRYFGLNFNDAPASYINWLLKSEEKFRSTNCTLMISAVEAVQLWLRRPYGHS